MVVTEALEDNNDSNAATPIYTRVQCWTISPKSSKQCALNIVNDLNVKPV